MKHKLTLKLTMCVILFCSFTIIAFSFSYGCIAVWQALQARASLAYTQTLDYLVTDALEQAGDSFTLPADTLAPHKPSNTVISNSNPEGLKRLLYMSNKRAEQAEEKLFRIESALGEAGIALQKDY